MGYDRISALPDCLITQILLWLPTQDSVKTSVLSTRWRNLWLDVPGLELHPSYFSSPVIKNFTDRFLQHNRHSRLEKFKITYHERYDNYVSGIIATVINRGAQHLDVDTENRWCFLTNNFMPLDIYKSKTLVSLKLVNVRMSSPGFVIFLPCLKMMHLEDIQYSDEDSLIVEKLISGCPLLEDLTVSRVFDDNVPVLRVRSQTLKRFCVRSGPVQRRLGDVEYAVEIDSPRLKYMNFRDDQCERILVRDLSSLFRIDIDTTFNLVPSEMKKDTICDFLTGISSVRHMIISLRTFKVLYRYMGHVSMFHNLCRLEASFSNLLLQVLPSFLKSFPNLKHLTLCLVYLRKLEQENLELYIVPRCLRSTLECVEIKEVITGEEPSIKGNWRPATNVLKHRKKFLMKAVRYILANSFVLKKLILFFSPMTNQVSDTTKELLTFTKRSRRCDIFMGLLHLETVFLQLIG